LWKNNEVQKQEEKHKIFLPVLISVVVTILLFYFSLIFIEDYREFINYIFIGLIYVYIYVNLYKLFNGRYIVFLERYINLFKKIKIIKKEEQINDKLMKKDKKYRMKLKFVYILFMICFVSLLLFIWQMISEIYILEITSIICLVVLFISFVVALILLKVTVRSKRKNKK